MAYKVGKEFSEKVLLLGEKFCKKFIAGPKEFLPLLLDLHRIPCKAELKHVVAQNRLTIFLFFFWCGRALVREVNQKKW